jgi:hypothetical protein
MIGHQARVQASPKERPRRTSPGKIRETDRAKVIFMVNFIVKPRFDENGAVIPRNSLN